MSILGRKKKIHINLYPHVIQKAKALAKAKRISLSRFIELLLISEDEVYQAALVKLLQAGERSVRFSGLRRKPEVECAPKDEFGEDRNIDETKNKVEQDENVETSKKEPPT